MCVCSCFIYELDRILYIICINNKELSLFVRNDILLILNILDMYLVFYLIGYVCKL